MHYVTPTEDNQYQTMKMKSHGLFSEVNTEVGQIIVAAVNHSRVDELLAQDRVALWKLIRKGGLAGCCRAGGRPPLTRFADPSI